MPVFIWGKHQAAMVEEGNGPWLWFEENMDCVATLILTDSHCLPNQRARNAVAQYRMRKKHIELNLNAFKYRLLQHGFNQNCS